MSRSHESESGFDAIGSRLVGALVWLPIIGLVSAVFFLVFGLRALVYSYELPVPALVIAVDATKLVDVDTRGLEELLPWVALRVTTPEGSVVDFGLSPNMKTFKRIRVGQTLLVRFNPRNPLSSVLEEEYRAGRLSSVVAGWAIAAMLALGSSAGFFLSLRRRPS